MELNEGIRLLTGKAKIVLPLKKKEAPEKAAPAVPPSTAGAATFDKPVSTTCTVVENGSTRRFSITIEPPAGVGSAVATTSAEAATSANGTPVYSPFQGKTELVEINVSTGDSVTKGQVVAAVEAMKAKHDVKAPCGGTVLSIDAGIGADIEAGKSIMTIGA